MSDGTNGAYPAGQQGYPPQQQSVLRQSQPMPKDYMVFAILVTFCCCLPLGIVAIIKSSEVRNRYTAGDYQGAEDASQAAKKWSIAGLVAGGIILVFVIIIYAISIASGAST